MGKVLELPWTELLSTGRGVGRLGGTGILCSGSLCSSTAWLQTVEVDHQTLAWITGQLDPVGAVCKSLVVQSLLQLFCTSGLPHPVKSSLQSLLELPFILR